MITIESFRRARSDAGWTYEQAAEKIGVSLRTVRYWGTRPPPERMWTRVATVLPAAWVGEKPFVPPVGAVLPLGERVEALIAEAGSLRQVTTDPTVRSHLREALDALMRVEDALLDEEPHDQRSQGADVPARLRAEP